MENGKAPQTLRGTTRPICPYPTVARWNGHGDPADGAAYACTEATRMAVPTT